MKVQTNRAVRVSGGLLVALVLFAFLGPAVSPHNYLQTDFSNILQAPSLAGFHLFGTDDLGRDLFVRTMLGVQVTDRKSVV